MRLHLLTLVVLAGPLNGFVAAGDPTDIWQPEYDTAAAVAEATGRPLLIHFYADWCGPCRQMEARVLNRPSLQDSLRNRVVAVKLDYDEHAEIVHRYRVDALPCDLLLDSNGDVLLRTTGFVGESTYVERIERLAPAAPERNRIPATLSDIMNHTGGARHLGAVRDVGTRLVVSRQ